MRAETRLIAPPHVPEIRLHLADEALDLWRRTEEELDRMGLPPPYWAFAWAGGQALARYILDNPHLVAGRRVLDFAAGSGIVAIAAAKAGAASVLATDIDGFSLAAIALNAAANGVVVEASSIDVLATGAAGHDVVLAGDVFYEKPMADRVEPFLRSAKADGALVLFGDPGRSYIPKSGVEAIATYEVPVTRALEDSEVKRTRVWRFTD
nr:50S ribosomal protein L11 methyltransferase [Mongoliimonas terrestris]